MNVGNVKALVEEIIEARRIMLDLMNLGLLEPDVAGEYLIRTQYVQDAYNNAMKGTKK